MKTSICAIALLCALSAHGAEATAPVELALRAAVEQAARPGDIVRAADVYLRAFPGADAAAAVRAQQQRADAASRLVGGNEVRLCRGAFAVAVAVGGDRRLAALGGRDAVARLARHEAMATALGYRPASALDNARK